MLLPPAWRCVAPLGEGWQSPPALPNFPAAPEPGASQTPVLGGLGCGQGWLPVAAACPPLLPAPAPGRGQDGSSVSPGRLASCCR